MKIRKINIANNNILGNVVLDFCDVNGVEYDNIIFAGENGTGKSTILNIIFEFSKYNLPNINSSEKRIFEIRLSDDEKNLILSHPNTTRYFNTGIKDNILNVTIDLSLNDWKKVELSWNDSTNTHKTKSGSLLYDNDLRSIFKSVFSDVEINYSPNKIVSPTSKEVDQEVKTSEKSSKDLATDITQLLIDIETSDNDDIGNWIKKNPNKIPPISLTYNRMKRFNDAFSYMFPSKEMDRIDKINNNRKVVFKESNREMYIEELSSGEKQIVFRGSFLLKNQQSIKGTVILIDEPEISMHPKWQKKIVNFYRKLFTTDTGVQMSQIFFVTHSETILKEALGNNDVLVIRLNKDTVTGKVSANKIDVSTVLPILTSAEVNYLVFGTYSVDFHIQLFNYVPYSLGRPSNTGVLAIDRLIRSHSEYDISLHYKRSANKSGSYIYDTLPTYIRNQIHHASPVTFTIKELTDSIELLIKICS